MMIQLWKSMAFWYLFELWDGVNGYQKLGLAIKLFCRTFDSEREQNDRFCAKDEKDW